MPYAGYHLACRELVNSHHLLLPANQIITSRGDHSKPGGRVEPGDGVGEC